MSSIATASDGDMLTHAIGYAELRGWPVFPVEPRGKRPLGRLAPHGLKDATLDLDEIHRWWRICPDANIGLLTGEHFDVLDIDGEEGCRTFDQLCAEHYRPRVGGVSRTGGGGFHYLFQPTALGNRAGFKPNLDWRGAGGYIVAPPSIHATGARYDWDQDDRARYYWDQDDDDFWDRDEESDFTLAAPWWLDLPSAPWWLHTLLDPPGPYGVVERARARVAGGQATDYARPGQFAGTNYGRAALDDETDRVASAPAGRRNDTLNRAAFSLGQLVGAGCLDAALVVAELLQAALQTGLGTREAERTIISGLGDGIRQPRQVKG